MQEFEEIYAQYYRRTYKYVMCLCQNPVLAEEITQETFFKAFRSIHTFKGDCKISSWLCQIAKNTYYNQQKRERTRGKYATQTMPLSTDIEEKFLDKEATAAIHRTLHRMREPYKEVFWLKAFGELCFREIGDLFDKSESWARVTYYRAKMMIREEME